MQTVCTIPSTWVTRASSLSTSSRPKWPGYVVRIQILNMSPCRPMIRASENQTRLGLVICSVGSQRSCCVKDCSEPSLISERGYSARSEDHHNDDSERLFSWLLNKTFLRVHCDLIIVALAR